MKIAIVSDMHIGYERFYEDAYRQARQALEMASSEADMIILPGDIFDKRNPHADAIGQAIDIFRDLNRKHWKARVTEFRPYREMRSFTSVPIIAIPGTHERVAEGRKNPLGLLGLAGLLVDASESRVTVEKDGERVSVFGMGGLSEERVLPTIKDLNPKPVDGSFNVFMFHQSLYELLPFRDDFIRYEDLPEGFDLYVDGHIHSKVVDRVHGKPFLIPGSTVLTQLKDGEQDRKGFFIYDTRSNSYEFREIDSRPFFALHVELENATPKSVEEECGRAVEEAIAKSAERPIIKLIMEGPIAEGFHAIDMPVRALHSRYSQSSYIEIESRLVDSEVELDISEVREGKLEGMSIRELGMGILNSKLSQSGFEGRINTHELFNALCLPKKEKAVSEAARLFEPLGQPQ